MHNSPAVSSAKSFDLTSTAFLIVAFLTGIAGALQTPTLSIFLTDEVHARPAMVGFFFTGSAVIGILVSQFLAGRSDKRGDRKSLIVFCCLLGVLACTLFAWNRNYFVLLFVGVFLSSFGSTANPQMFALAREHADKTGREAVMFSSFLRAQVSLAWVIGPPLAYALAMGFSFTVMYLSAAVAFIVCGVMVWLFLRRNADGAFTCHSVGLAAAKCYFYWHSGRYRDALFSGFDARSGRFSHHALYQHVARGLDHRRISGGHRRRDLELSRCVLVCDGDDYRHSVLLTAD